MWGVGEVLKTWRDRWIGGAIMSTANLPAIRACRPARNKGRIVGQKRPLQPKHVWAIRVRLEIAQRTRELALFNLAIASNLRGCDLVRLKVSDVYAAGQCARTSARLIWSTASSRDRSCVTGVSARSSAAAEGSSTSCS